VSFMTMRRPGNAASTIPVSPPSEVSTQSTSSAPSRAINSLMSAQYCGNAYSSGISEPAALATTNKIRAYDAFSRRGECGSEIVKIATLPGGAGVMARRDGPKSEDQPHAKASAKASFCDCLLGAAHLNPWDYLHA
jgi:hypothetical protein